MSRENSISNIFLLPEKGGRIVFMTVFVILCCFVGGILSTAIQTTSLRTSNESKRQTTERSNNKQHIFNEQEQQQQHLPTNDLFQSNPNIESLLVVQQATTSTNNSTSSSNSAGVHPRVFTQWPLDKPLPCYEAENDWISTDVQNSPTKSGLLFLKPYKTGSSTGSGINLRIARNVAKTRGYDMCELRFDHGPDMFPGVTLFSGRSYEKSFLWTVIREPTARSVSSFFHFAVSRNGVEPTDENFKKDLAEQYPTNDYYLHALYTEGWFDNRTTIDPIHVSNQIMQEFNFIGITERMDESAVALMMLMNLKLADILYLSAKRHGGYDDGGGTNGCSIIQPSFVSPGMKEFFESEQWKEFVQYDLALYQAANKSLDMTIDSLGRDQFEQNLALFKRALKIASEKCLPITRFPCGDDGIRRFENETHCLWQDSGCGTECLDEVATELNLW